MSIQTKELHLPLLAAQDDEVDDSPFSDPLPKGTRTTLASDDLIIHAAAIPLDPAVSQDGKLGSLRLCLFGFFSVAGGPFGIEPSVQGAGPLLTLLGLIYIPLLWGVPVALVTAELAAIFPANGGCAVFSFHAFRSKLVGFMTGWVGTMGTVVTQASYMLLIISYADAAIPNGLSVAAQMFCILGLGVITGVANLFNIGALGSANSVLVLLVLLPFLVLVFIAIPGSEVSNWGVVLPPAEMHLNVYVSNLLWNMQGFASMGAIAGEVKNPKKTYVRGTLGCVVLVALNYAIPVMTATAHCSDWHKWKSGYLSTAAATIAGSWMSDWISVSAVVANLSMLLSSLAGGSRTVSGMAALSFMPPVFARTLPKTGSPYVAVIVLGVISIVIALAFSQGSNSTGFNLLVDASAILGAIPPIVQLVAFVWLRYSQPNLERPFKAPGGWPFVIFALLSPAGLFMYLACSGAPIALALAGGCVVLGAMFAVVLMVVTKNQPDLAPLLPSDGGSAMAL